MGRPLRIESADTWFHVMNRGAARQRIFHTKQDGRQFLALLRDGSERFGVEVHAFCLMSNHYHLLVRCPSGGLSELMHYIASHYVRYFNDRLARDGPMFRGRFTALPLGNTQYVDTVGRYIHRNPLAIQPPVDLDTYEWSSMRYYVGALPSPRWLRTGMLLGEHARASAYRAFVHSDPSGEPLWPWALDTAIAELVDEPRLRTNLTRSVAVAMLDQIDDVRRASLERWLAFPGRKARNQALWRMRERLSTDPIIATLAARALELAR